MKVVWVILIFMMVFNGMMIFTNELGIFDYSYETSMSESDFKNYSALTKNESEVAKHGAFGFNFEWDDALAALAGIGIVAGAIGLAKWTHSPVPLAVGAFTAFSVAMWIKTSVFLYQFGVHNWFLTIGTAGMGIMMVATTIEMMGGGNDA